MKIYNESVQLIHIGPHTKLTTTAIQYALQRAQSNRMYAKFYTDRYFIQVNFMKDYTINVTSNITLPQFVNSMRQYESRGWTFASAKDFVFKWMSINRHQIGR